MANIRLIKRRDSEFYARLPKVQEVSLCDELANNNKATVCRTCTRSNNPLWNTTKEEQIIHINQGGKREDLFCDPTKPWGSYKVLNQISHIGRIVSLDSETDVPTRAIVETCGQNIRIDCMRCDRFNAKVVRVAYTTSREGQIAFRTQDQDGTYVTVPYVTDGSPVKYWNVTIGGSCSIPEQGIKIKGTVKFCDWQERKKRIESPSCGNCYYADAKGESWQFNHLEVNENARLTPWEREQVPPDEIGLALWRKQSDPVGRRYWFEATVIATAVRQNRTLYKIRFKANHVEAIIAEDDDRFVIYNLDQDRIAVDILYPYNKLFRLTMPTKKRNRIWPSLPEKVLVEDNCADSSVPTCSACRANKACYYHAKAPVVNLTTGTIDFAKPAGRTTEWVYPPQGLMHISKRQGKIVAVDGNENMPLAYSSEVANASVFRMWLPTLLEQANYKYGKDGAKAIYKQYLSVVGMLHKTIKEFTYRPSWLRNTSTEPNKTYCSHPNGPNLRKVFQDSFGSERVDWDFDHGAMTHDQVEEELRVGYRQHSQTPQRLQEEILATDASHPRYDPASGSIPDLGVTVTPVTIRQIPAVGGMHREDGSPVTSTREFVDHLEDEVTVGMSGEVERVISKRQQLYGYQMSRGYYGKRRGFEKTAMPAADPTYAIFEMEHLDPDQIDIADVWMCPDCSATYDLVEIENFFDPLCDCGASLYRNHNTRETFNPRQGGGVGNAFVMDTLRTQEQQRLFSTLCPHWRLNATTIITLDDVYGPTDSAPAQQSQVHIDEPVKTLKVQGDLTQEHKASNAAYKVLFDEVISKRSAHMERFPDTTKEELHELYPTPRGTVYEQKAAGSLSKMGSS